MMTQESQVEEMNNKRLMLLLGVDKNKIDQFQEIDINKTSTPNNWTSEQPLNRSLLTQNNADWMSNVPNNTNISKLAIPGTHDSCTNNFISFWNLFKPIVNFFGRTQSWNLTEQLEAGIRYIDLRTGGDGIIYHGVLQTTSTFRGAFEEMKNFLLAHKNEGLIIRAKFENVSFCIDDCVETEVRSVLNDYKEFLYLSKTIPTMEQLRGKMFIMVNYEYGEAFDWNRDRFQLQDYYDLQGTIDEAYERKKNLIQEYMNLSLKENSGMIINHCSAAGNHLLVSIKNIADAMNEIPYTRENYAGIIVLDYPSEDLVNRIIAKNSLIINKNNAQKIKEDKINKNTQVLKEMNKTNKLTTLNEEKKSSKILKAEVIQIKTNKGFLQEVESL